MNHLITPNKDRHQCTLGILQGFIKMEPCQLQHLHPNMTNGVKSAAGVFIWKETCSL